MDSRERDAPVVLQYLSLPAKLRSGLYDARGNKLSEKERHRTRVVLHELPGDPSPWQCWGVVEEPLDPGQSAQVTFFNVGGSAVPGGAFTEWDAETAKPTFSEALLSVESVSRALGRARIVGRNGSPERIRAAAGLLFVPPREPASKRKEGGGSTEEKPRAPVEVPAAEKATKTSRKRTGRDGREKSGGRRSGSAGRGGRRSPSSEEKES